MGKAVNNLRGDPAKPTILTVARAAGVSSSTVSEVLNYPGKHRYSKDVEAKILQASRTLGYIPNALARSLARQMNPAIGLVCESLSDLNIVRAVNRAVELAAARGSHIVLSTNPREIPWQRLLEEGRTGWIIAIGNGMIEQAKELKWPQLLARTILISDSVRYESLPVACLIGWHSSRSGFLAAEHLAALGHRQIAILAGGERYKDHLRITAARDRALELGMTVHWMILPDEDPEDYPSSGQKMTREVLERYPGVTALICRQDYIAVGAYRQLHRAGKRIPEDMAVVGHLDLQSMLFLDPPLTSTLPPQVEAVERAMEFALSNRPPEGKKYLDLTDEIRLIGRESTAGGAPE